MKYVEALSYEEMPWLGDPNMPAVDVRLPELRGRDRSSMRMRGGFGVIVLAMSTLVALGPSAVRAQELRLVGRVPDAARVRVDSVLDRARAAGLPTEPIVDRALEGAAKGESSAPRARHSGKRHRPLSSRPARARCGQARPETISFSYGRCAAVGPARSPPPFSRISSLSVFRPPRLSPRCWRWHERPVIPSTSRSGAMSGTTSPLARRRPLHSASACKRRPRG